MPPAAKSAKPAEKSASLALICGDDDFSVRQRARTLYAAWCAEAGGMDHETIDAAAQNAGEALRALGRLREAINTLPFFGGSKVVWFKDCSFLGEDRMSSSAAVTEALAALAEELRNFRWDGVRLLISGVKPDRRRSYFKAFEKLGTVELFTALSADDKDWASAAESHALRLLRELRKEINDDALADLVSRIGPNLRSLASEIDKLAAYVGSRTEIHKKDVEAIVSRQKQARAFALAEALGDRDLPRLLKTLDEELWELRIDKKRSEIGLLYGLITKVRNLLFLKDLRDAGILKAARDYNSFKGQLDRVPTESLPADKRFNPLASHPFTLFQAARQVDNYAIEELVQAMSVLLECNRKLVSSDLDEALVLQQALVQIVGFRSGQAAARAR